MNELRWILLGIGVLVIAGIYFWESTKQKRNLRSRVENYSPPDKDSISNIRINPKKERNIDISGALATFNSYLKQSRKSTAEKDVGLDTIPAETDAEDYDFLNDAAGDQPTRGKNKQQEIMVIYITAESSPGFNGPDILHALESADMQFGDMNIFHYHGPDKNHATRALFSLANIHEPGSFDIDNMDRFSTNGLALFMCLPADIGGDIAFELMLDTAHNLAYLLGGELRDADRKILDTEKLNKMREIASRY
jgi:cell division protein ZipA